MPSAPPPGDPVPSDGPPTAEALKRFGADPGRRLGWYVHVPFCTVRCGYCDFNTYTKADLGGRDIRSDWSVAAVREVRLARRLLGDLGSPADTVFFGGGTPTLLPPRELARVVDEIRDTFGLSGDVEITAEANPDTLRDEVLAGLLEAGVNRLSIGMQSAVQQTLDVLDRTHRAEALPGVVDAARRAGFDRISLDLIYGTPGETSAQWQTTLDTALAMQPDHVSAYGLVVEPGTALHRRVRGGEVAEVNDDEAAERYEAADAAFVATGMCWYEVSNWSLPGQESRHNLRYWHNLDWWGVGPGAHSHLRGVRWWNRSHPVAWMQALASGHTPAQAREILTSEQSADEALMLGLRLADGVSLHAIPGFSRGRVPDLVADGLVVAVDDRIVLTGRGRLLADRVVLSLLEQP